jgi:nitrite reductase (NADH) small subunit
VTAGIGTQPAIEHLVGALDDFAPGRIHLVTVEGRDVGIVRTPTGVYAIGNRCPHQGAPLCRGVLTGTMVSSGPDEYIYDLDGLVVQCPWHAYEFRIDTGRSVGGALRGRVPIYTVCLRDGQVFVSLARPSVGGSS